MKRLLGLLFIIIFLGACNAISQAQTQEVVQPIQLEMRNYDEITLPVGTFIPVITTQEISTETCPEGFKTKFISTTDLFMYETNIIPKNTEFFGYIEKIHEPVIGTNASMKIKITKLIYVLFF